MKNSIILIAISLIPLFSIADEGKSWDYLLDHELKVVLNNKSEELNKSLKEAVEKNWKLSKFSFVDGQEETKLMEANADFPFMSIMTEEYYDYKTSLTTKETFLMIYYYSKKNRYSSIDKVKINNLRLRLDAQVLMNYAVKELSAQGFLNYNCLGSIRKSYKGKETNIFDTKEYEMAKKKWKQATMNNIKKDTLFVCPDYLDPEIATEDKFKQVFPYTFRFITEQEVFDIINNSRPKGYLLLVQKSPSEKEQNDLVFETSNRLSTAKYSFHFLLNANSMKIVSNHKIGFMKENKDKVTKKFLKEMLDPENIYYDSSCIEGTR